jgi:hypothetical protein
MATNLPGVTPYPAKERKKVPPTPPLWTIRATLPPGGGIFLERPKGIIILISKLMVPTQFGPSILQIPPYSEDKRICPWQTTPFTQ